MKLSTFRPVTWVLIGALCGTLFSVQLGAIARDGKATIPVDEIQQLASVFGMIKQNYVEPVPEKRLIKDAIAGMVAGLDPHSQYLDEKAYKEFREGTSGQFVGIGIEIGMEDGFVKVISPIEDTPAFRAGLKPGDLITSVDGTSIKGLAIDEAVKRIRGLPGTKVVLQILRKADKTDFALTLTRAPIVNRSVRSKIIEPGYAWIRVSQFQEKTLEDFTKRIQEIYQQEPALKGLVLDLRNDPGGLLDAAIGISAVFLPEDVTIVSTKGQMPEANEVFKASPEFYSRRSPGTTALKALPPAIKKVPVVVLVNEGSASASEIVAAALQDYKRATIMGHTTFGKGSVQTSINITANTALKITTARYYTPSGRTIQATGVKPDISVDEYADGDPLAVLRTREADLNHQIGAAASSPQAAELNAEREAAKKLLDSEKKTLLAQRKPYSYGEADDFPLRQAINFLSGKKVELSKSVQQSASSPGNT